MFLSVIRGDLFAQGIHQGGRQGCSRFQSLVRNAMRSESSRQCVHSLCGLNFISSLRNLSGVRKRYFSVAASSEYPM